MSLEATEQSPDHPADNGSVLDDLGAEVTGIAFPVSVCMAITVALVRLLHGDGEDQERVFIGEAIYGEKVRCRASSERLRATGSQECEQPRASCIHHTCPT